MEETYKEWIIERNKKKYWNIEKNGRKRKWLKLEQNYIKKRQKEREVV